MITGAAKVAGVVGWPVAHSLSPLIHNAWIEALGLDAVYVPFAVPPDMFRSFLSGMLGAKSLAGLNVTLPLKEMAAAATDVCSPTVRDCEAANLLYPLGDDWFAENTDGVGLLAALGEQAPRWTPTLFGPVAILGAGGAARGAMFALHKAGVRDLRIIARRPEAAELLAGEYPVLAQFFGFRQLGLALDGVTLIINATSAGLNGVGELPDMDAAPPGAVFMDMVYKPLRTTFLRDAAARGHATVDGLAMLIGQARPSFEVFFGVPPPSADVVDVRALCLKSLGEMSESAADPDRPGLSRPPLAGSRPPVSPRTRGER